MRTSALLLGFVLLTSCADAPRSGSAAKIDQPVEIIDAVWTPAAAERADRLSMDRANAGKKAFELPLVRAYNSKRGLVFNLPSDWASETLDDELEDAIGSHWEIDGVPFAQAVADVELRDGRPLLDVIATSDAPVVFDYWNDWCAQCKAIDEKLIDWAHRSENGPVRIVRVKADPLKIAEARGDRIVVYKRGADGRVSKQVVN